MGLFNYKCGVSLHEFPQNKKRMTKKNRKTQTDPRADAARQLSLLKKQELIEKILIQQELFQKVSTANEQLEFMLRQKLLS